MKHAITYKSAQQTVKWLRLARLVRASQKLTVKLSELLDVTVECLPWANESELFQEYGVMAMSWGCESDLIDVSMF